MSSTKRPPQLPLDVLIMFIDLAIDSERGPDAAERARSWQFPRNGPKYQPVPENPRPDTRGDPIKQEERLMQYALVHRAFFQQTRRGIRRLLAEARGDEQVWPHTMWPAPESTRDYVKFWEEQIDLWICDEDHFLPHVPKEPQDQIPWCGFAWLGQRPVDEGRLIMDRVDVLEESLEGLNGMAAEWGWGDD